MSPPPVGKQSPFERGKLKLTKERVRCLKVCVPKKGVYGCIGRGKKSFSNKKSPWICTGIQIFPRGKLMECWRFSKQCYFSLVIGCPFWGSRRCGIHFVLVWNRKRVSIVLGDSLVRVLTFYNDFKKKINFLHELMLVLTRLLLKWRPSSVKDY